MSTETEIDSQHFTEAVVKLGNSRPVVASQPIFNAQGIKIVEGGTPINGDLYERLVAHHLQSPIEHSLTTEGAVTGRSLRTSMEEMLARHPFYARMATPVERVTRLDILDKLPLPGPVAFQLTLAREMHPDQYDHALRSAWTMMWMVSGPTNLRFDVGMAAVTGLVHDIAMLHLDPVLLDPTVQLSRDQRRQLYSHPIIGARLLERHHEYPKEVARAVLEHHECENGSGYPRSLISPQISTLGRAMALTEMVTAMVGGSHPGGELRLSVLLRMNMHRFDRALISRVMGLLRPEQDPGSHEINLLEQPTRSLRDIDAALQDWPSNLALQPDLAPERQAGMAIVANQIGQLQRSLAEAGLAPEQLDQLGDSGDDPLLPRELSLLASEAAWQLRTLARQTRRRWRGGPDGSYAPELQQWLDRCEALCAQVLATMAPHDLSDD